MSDKIYLKEITLPIVETGENETYSFVQTDADLDTAGDAADAKAVGDELSNLKQDLDGLDVYTLGLYPQMSVADTAVASFTDGADDIPVKSLTVDITPVQSGSGDPSPSNVRPISGWTGANVSVTGVNVWDEETKAGYYDRATGVYTSASGQLCSANFISVLPDTNYYFKHGINGESTYGNVVYYDKNETYIDGISWAGNSVFTTPSNCYYIHINLGSTYGSTYNHNVSINYPSTDHDYHAYKGNVYSITFPTEVGTVYGGTLDVTNGVLTVDHVKKELTGAETSWSQYDASSPYNYYMVSLGYNRNTCVTGSGICTHFPAATINSSNDSLGFRCADSSSLNKFGAFFRWDMSGDFDTLEKFKTYVAEQYSNNTPIEVCFKVNSGETYQLTPTEVATILGQNNIFADTGDIAELTYRADLKAYIDAHVGS